jgi:proteasome lid subunit RPN8/RPN11
MSIFHKNKAPPKSKPWQIQQSVLELIFECAKSSYPNEFGGFLKVDEKNPYAITELVLIPGTISGDAHAIFKMHMLPIDFTIKGTVHSHPSVNYTPSEADITLFQKYGQIHIISAYPYSQESWGVYSYKGNPIEIKVF